MLSSRHHPNCARHAGPAPRPAAAAAAALAPAHSAPLRRRLLQQQQQQHNQALRTHRRRRCVAAAAGNTTSSSPSSSSFGEAAQRFADTTQQRMQDFVKQQRLEQRAAEASKAAQEKLRELGQETEQNVRRTYMKLESEHNISQRLRRVQTSVAEAARDLDQEWSLRQRLRSALEDSRRMLPQWRRQAAAFSATPLGKASLTLLFVALLFSGLLWQLLNAAWLLWWVSIPVSLLLASQRSKQAAEAAAAAAAAQQQQQARQRGPFGGWGGSSASSNSSGGVSSARGYGNSYGEGPVVEAEWVSLDDGDEPSGGSSRRR